MIVKKLDDGELALVEIIRHPVWCGDFIRAQDDEEEVWEYTDYQLEFLCDFSPYVSIRAGRAVGKTVTLIDKLTWFVLNRFWNETIVYTVPNRSHLEPVFLKLTRWFRHHSLLRHYTGKQGVNAQTYTIKTLNGVVVDCRIAGMSGTGANVVGLHVPIIILDEDGLYPWGTYIELIPCLNTFNDGFQFIAAGVPTGMREKNVCYYVDTQDSKFTKHRISAHRNPRYTEEDEQRNLRQFGGVEGEDYIHMVLGEHGTPAYMMFDRSKMFIGDYNVFTGSLYGTKLNKDPEYLSRFYAALPRPPKDVQILIGIDLGYTEPTEIHILSRRDDSDPWRFIARCTLYQIAYPTQEQIINQLDSIYNPFIIGIDEGSSGKAVVQHLLSDPTTAHKNYKEKLVPVEFQGNVIVGIDNDGNEVQSRTKEFGMQLLQAKANNRGICFSVRDEEIISELERTTYTRTTSGALVFRTMTPRGGIRHGSDHNVAALMCAFIALYKKVEMWHLLQPRRANLYKPRWFSGI